MIRRLVQALYIRLLQRKMRKNRIQTFNNGLVALQFSRQQINRIRQRQSELQARDEIDVVELKSVNDGLLQLVKKTEEFEFILEQWREEAARRYELGTL